MKIRKYINSKLAQFKQWILSIVSCWISFNKKFPEVGEKIKLKQIYNTKYGKIKHTSEIFEWAIKEDSKNEWLDAGLSNMFWKSYN